jgi:hypothetical protein
VAHFLAESTLVPHLEMLVIEEKMTNERRKEKPRSMDLNSVEKSSAR